MTRRALLAACLALAAAVPGCTGPGTHPGSSGSPSQLIGDNPGGRFQGAELDPAQPRPSFTLTDTSGALFAFRQRTAGHPTLLYFGYTNCPDVCPQTMADIAVALKSLPQPVQARTDVVFVSTDVAHDTAAVLTTWLAHFTAGTAATFIGLRGTQPQIDAAQAAAHVTVAQDGGQTHSAQVLLYGADDYARVTFLQSTTEQQQIAHDLPLVATR